MALETAEEATRRMRLEDALGFALAFGLLVDELTAPDGFNRDRLSATLQQHAEANPLLRTREILACCAGTTSTPRAPEDAVNNALALLAKLDPTHPKA